MIELIISLFLFGALHSGMATHSFKRFASAWMGESIFSRYYRLIYNLISLVSFFPSLWFAMRPSAQLWQAMGFSNYIFIAVQVLAILCILISLKQIDWRAFLGIQQQFASSFPQEELLVITGFYKYVRHPLYVFSSVLIWFRPIMTINWFIFCLCCSLYFVIGSYFEEIKLQTVYGAAYADYKRKTFWFF